MGLHAILLPVILTPWRAGAIRLVLSYVPRANRYLIAGQVYHLTHRCHDRRFLFKFARDGNAYRMKLREGVERFKNELMGLRQRFRILNMPGLLRALGGVTTVDFRRQYEALLLERIAQNEISREPRWTEAIAVGSEAYVREMEGRIEGRQRLSITGADDNWTLQEAADPYGTFLRG